MLTPHDCVYLQQITTRENNISLAVLIKKIKTVTTRTAAGEISHLHIPTALSSLIHVGISIQEWSTDPFRWSAHYSVPSFARAITITSHLALQRLKGITGCFSARYDVLKILLEQMSMYRKVYFIDLHKVIHYWRKVNISTNKIQNRYSFVKISKRPHYDSK